MKKFFEKLNKMSIAEIIAIFSGVMICVTIIVAIGATILGMAYDLVLTSEYHVTAWEEQMKVREYATTVGVAKAAIFLAGYFTICNVSADAYVCFSKKKKEKLPE